MPVCSGRRVVGCRPLPPGRAMTSERKTLLRRTSQTCVVLLLLPLGVVSCRRHGSGTAPGLVVEQVDKGGAADKAGLRAGDRLLEWERQEGRPADRSGRFQDAFDVGEVEVEEGPRGRVVLHGRRDGQPLSWTLPPGDWRLTPRPSEGAWREASWRLLREGRDHAKAKRWPQAGAAFDKARAIAGAAGSLVVESRAWEAQGAAAVDGRDLPQAEEAFRHALELRQKLAAGGENLAVAMAQGRVASVAFQRGNLAAAEDLWTRSLHIREREAPGSLSAGNCLIGLGAIISGVATSTLAAAMLQRALAIRESAGARDHRARPGPGKPRLREARAGRSGRGRGALPAQPRRPREIAPGGPETGTALIHLGVLALTRGEWEAAEAYMRRALRIHEKHDPRSRFVTACLQQPRRNPPGARPVRRGGSLLSTVTEAGRGGQPEQPGGRGEPQQPRRRRRRVRQTCGQARALLESALALHRRLAPGSLDMARNLSALGELAAGEKAIRPRLAAGGRGPRPSDGSWPRAAPRKRSPSTRWAACSAARDGQPRPASDGSWPCAPSRTSAAASPCPSRARPRSGRATARSSATSSS